jgi:cellulose synthase/poly-beta-1,6-N-acetylglucosamine synthase-like glycosyltransferase
MIYYFTPFIKGNLGEAYNHYCNLVPDDDDWITMMDGDIMMLHLDWAEKWRSILEQNTNAGIVTCVTNRIGTKAQRIEAMKLSDSIKHHKKFAIQLFDENGTSVVKTNSPISGMFFAFKKSTWKLVGGFKNGILGVDYNFSNKVLQHTSIVIALGFYVLHYYRFIENNTNHLKR